MTSLAFGTSGDLSVVLARYKTQVEKDVSEIAPPVILTENLDVIVSVVTARNCPEEVVVHWDRLTRSAAREASVKVQGWPGAQDVIVRSTAVEVVVPVDGPVDLLRYQASTYNFSAIPGVVGKQVLTRPFNERSLTVEAINRAVESWRVAIDQRVVWQNQDLAGHRTACEASVRELVSARRRRLLDAQQLDRDLAIPVLLTSTNSASRVPVTPKVTTFAARASQATYVPEPLLDEAIFEDILGVCQAWARGFERTPATAAKFHEEEIRDNMLITLNTHWSGQAGAELFNGAGKTDILIRSDDRNVFIAEFKIWKGPAGVPLALDQLLNYLVWRDSKAVLVMVIKQKDPTAVIKRLDEAVRGHDACLLAKHSPAPDSRRDYVFRAKDDVERRISLAVLPVVVREMD